MVLDWALQLCDIFAYLHGLQPPVIYRDLKPKNVIKTPEGRLILVDFGIARVLKDYKSRDTEPMGSALTASPEHYGMAQTDRRSDIYTLGATLHFLLSNGRGPDEPFRFKPIRKVNPKISENFEKVLLKALNTQPEERFQSIEEMAESLRGELNDEGDPTIALAETASKTEAATLRWNGWLPWALVAVLAGLLLAQNSSPPKPVALATRLIETPAPSVKLTVTPSATAKPSATPTISPTPQATRPPKPSPAPRPTHSPSLSPTPTPASPSYPKASPRRQPPTVAMKPSYPKADFELKRPGYRITLPGTYHLALPPGFQPTSDVDWLTIDGVTLPIEA